MKMMASAFTARLASVLAVGSLLLLSACGLPDPALDNFYEPATHYDRYPIEVEKAEVTKVLRVKLGVLRREEVNAVVNFAQDARKNAESKITVSWPSGNSRLRAPAAKAVGIMVDLGVPRNKIELSSYKANAAAPIRMSYIRKLAVTAECGDWSENLAVTGKNTAYPNYGCAMQHNIAAMVSNPKDFEQPRAMSPVTANRRPVAW